MIMEKMNNDDNDYDYDDMPMTCGYSENSHFYKVVE